MEEKEKDKDLELDGKKVDEEQMGEVAGGLTNRSRLMVEEIPKIIYPD